MLDRKSPLHDEKMHVFSKALINLADRLSLTRQELSAILGKSEAWLSRLYAKSLFIDPHSKEGQLAVLLIRVYRDLDIIFGGNMAQSQIWLRSENHHLQNIPILFMQSIEGLVSVVQYLDAIKEKV